MTKFSGKFIRKEYTEIEPGNGLNIREKKRYRYIPVDTDGNPLPANMFRDRTGGCRPEGPIYRILVDGKMYLQEEMDKNLFFKKE